MKEPEERSSTTTTTITHDWCDDEQCSVCEARWDAGERPYPARRCVRCGHEECPCCPGGWCDTVLHSEADGGFVPDSEKNADGTVPWGWCVLCCGGECVYPLVYAVDCEHAGRDAARSDATAPSDVNS